MRESGFYHKVHPYTVMGAGGASLLLVSSVEPAVPKRSVKLQLGSETVRDNGDKDRLEPVSHHLLSDGGGLWEMLAPLPQSCTHRSGAWRS